MRWPTTSGPNYSHLVAESTIALVKVHRLPQDLDDLVVTSASTIRHPNEVQRLRLGNGRIRGARRSQRGDTLIDRAVSAAKVVEREAEAAMHPGLRHLIATPVGRLDS